MVSDDTESHTSFSVLTVQEKGDFSAMSEHDLVSFSNFRRINVSSIRAEILQKNNRVSGRFSVFDAFSVIRIDNFTPYLAVSTGNRWVQNSEGAIWTAADGDDIV